MLNFVSKLFGSSNKNKIKSYAKLIEKINDLEVNIMNLSDEDLKSKTKYDGPLNEPKKNLAFFFDLLICKIKLLLT